MIFICRDEKGARERTDPGQGSRMGRENVVSSLTMEMRRGTIVLLVLCCLDEPSYGYNLVESLAKKGIAVEANTLYPLLRRLASQGLLENRWDTSTAKPRKYYVITEEGRQVRKALREQWKAMSEAMQEVI